MRGMFIAALLVLPLGACASLRERPAAQPECRHVMTPQGNPLRICELGNRIVVDDRRIDPSATAAGDRRLVDDPQFLASMIAHLPNQSPKPPAGKKIAGKPGQRNVCTAAEPGYITIAVSDIEKLMRLAANVERSPTPEQSAQIDDTIR